MKRQGERTARASTDLRRLRKRIDRLDRQLVQALNRRAACAVRASHVKRQRGRPIVDRQREQQVLRRVLRANDGPLSQRALRSIYREILRANRSLGLSATRHGKGGKGSRRDPTD